MAMVVVAMCPMVVAVCPMSELTELIELMEGGRIA
jgi:hypothetical protein